VLGFGAIGESALGEVPETPLEAVVRHLRYAAELAPMDRAGAAAHYARAAPFFADLKQGPGRPELPPGATVGEQRLDMLERGISLERIAELEGYDIDVIDRSISRGRARRRERGQ
jgi:hypothetical protein